MVFIKREKRGKITGISSVPESGFVEETNEHADGLAEFLAISMGSAEFGQSDLDLIRVVEDLVEVLIGKGLIAITDLPSAVQRKLSERSKLRAKWRNSLELLSDNTLI